MTGPMLPMRDAPMSDARVRVVLAARTLFRENGVSGTSMQMVADMLGVTKGAVFYHFNTKRDLVVASVNLELDRLEDAVEAAEVTRSTREARELLLSFAVDRAVERRRDTASLHDDPVLVRIHRELGRYRDLMDRFYRVLFDLDTPEGRIDAAMLHAAIAQGVTSPLVADLDDTTLRGELLRTARRFLS